MKKHGHSAGGIISSTYSTWHSMISRCLYQCCDNYKYYGGRGIQVCKRWRQFKNFLADMGERPAGMTLERIDSDAGYFASNCIWATPTDQARNRRMTVPLTMNGQTKFVIDWSKELGISASTIYTRLDRGWNVSDALRTKLHVHRNQS